jgi:hypothetical protein
LVFFNCGKFRSCFEFGANLANRVVGHALKPESKRAEKRPRHQISLGDRHPNVRIIVVSASVFLCSAHESATHAHPSVLGNNIHGRVINIFALA